MPGDEQNWKSAAGENDGSLHGVRCVCAGDLHGHPPFLT